MKDFDEFKSSYIAWFDDSYPDNPNESDEAMFAATAAALKVLEKYHEWTATGNLPDDRP